MGTLGTRARNGKKPALPRTKRSEPPHPAVAKLAAALREHKAAVEQQAATAEILRAMSRSPGDAQPVFETIVEKAHRLCDAAYSVLYRYDGKLIHFGAAKDVNEKSIAAVRGRYPQPPDRHKLVGRTVLEGRVFHTEDLAHDDRFPAAGKIIHRRAVVSVPLLRDGTVLGVISCGRAEAKAFTRKEIGLLKTFADQAVIAIENARLFHDTREALERQKATADILRVLSSSPTDVQPVFQSIVRSGAQLCAGEQCTLIGLDGDKLTLLAMHNYRPEGEAVLRAVFPRPLSRDTASGRAIFDKRTVQIADTFEDAGYRIKHAHISRAVVSVPLMREGKSVGALTVGRQAPGVFSAHQVALLQTFADQAVLAIENVRLFNETKEALERQTATADILRVISQSQTDTQPVFDAIVRSAVRLCAGSFGSLLRIDGDTMHLEAHYNPSPEAHKLIASRFPAPLSEHSLVALAARTGEMVHSPDTDSDPRSSKHAIPKTLGNRAQLTVPLLRDGQAVALLNVVRDRPGSFSAAQIDLLKTFADQAVIAIENVRLFNETKEALDHQRVSADILRIVASSVENADPVFRAITDAGMRLVPGCRLALHLVRDGHLHQVSHSGVDPGHHAKMAGFYPLPIEDGGTPSAKAVEEKRAVHIPDIVEAGEHLELGREMARVSGWRAILAVPLMRAGEAIGNIAITRPEPGLFTDKQIALAKTFADQAVIAIENVRLFKETKEALERQTATAEILKVISRSPTDVQPVFDAVAERAAQLCNATNASVLIAEGDVLRRVAAIGHSVAVTGELPIRRTLVHGRAFLERRTNHVEDIVPLLDTEYPDARENQLSSGFRSLLSVPMIRDGTAVGTIGVWRREVKPFSKGEIDLLETFAAQAVIAIENVRLFNETRESLEQQTAISEVLRVISSSPTDVGPVLEAVAVRAARICDASDARIYMLEGEQFRHTAGFGDVPPVSESFPLNSQTPSGRAVIERTAQQIADLAAPSAARDLPIGHALAVRGGLRTVLSVPLLREDRALGTIVLRRREVRAFSDKQIALLKTFADQAAIAIENVRLFNETKEALERQTASAEILKVISGSPTDVQPVFGAIIRSAVQLCGGMFGNLQRFDGKLVHLVAHHNLSPEGLEVYRRIYPRPLGRDTVAGCAMLDRAVINLPDALDVAVPSDSRELAEASGFRSVLVVPMLHKGEPIGVINVARAQPGPFAPTYVEILKTFADQAVIAIENVRLFNETKESLEQQTATSNILGVISRSPTDLAPVFDAILKSALELCEAHLGHLNLYDGEHHRTVAHRGASAEFAKYLSQRGPYKPGPTLTRVAAERRPVQLHDMRQARGYLEGKTETVKLVEMGGARTALHVPLVKEDRTIGVIVIYRPQVQPFTEKQIALVSLFANQAVIAIENVRLFNETKEALEQQTATSEILKVISSSTTDTQPVFDTIVQSAAQLFPPCNVVIRMREADGLVLKARAGPPLRQTDATALANLHSLPLDPERSLAARAMMERRIIEVLDTESDGMPAIAKAVGRASGWRAITIVPLSKEGEGIGVIGLGRSEPGFKLTDKQLALVRTFADQAVIAIENVRLFRELRERTEALTRSVSQLTALGEVGQAISSTLDLQAVLKTIVAHAVRLAALNGGAIYEYDEEAEEYYLRASESYSDELVEALRRTPVRRGEGPIWQAGVTGQPTEIPEMLDESYQTPRREFILREGFRALLVVPLVHENHIVGALAVSRRAPGHFAPEVVELLKTFATQSALAIQNARLFREVQEKGRLLEVASRHKSDFLASMSHELRTPLNALLGFNELILGQVYGEVPSDMKPPLEQMQSSGKHLLRLINNVLDLAKIEAGRMELALSDYSVQDVVESVRSTLKPLAQEKGLEFAAAVPPELPLAHGDPGRITQCLLNLAGNSLKFTKAGKVEISVGVSDGRLRYCVADTGIGIPPEKIESLFTEFKQTDATIASEYGGTGLGLSISKKFVELHGGRIWVQSEPGRGSVFTFEVPLRAATP